MASTWGLSWGTSWGTSWDREPPVVVPSVFPITATTVIEVGRLSMTIAVGGVAVELDAGAATVTTRAAG